MAINDIFEAKSVNVQEVFTTKSPFYFIPAYQRQYSWNEPKLKKLFEDICHGYYLLKQIKDNVTFIGSIILINDRENKSVLPENKKGLPTLVLTVIDGQQRLTSLLILLSVLYERLVRLYSQYKFDDDNENEYLLKNLLLSTIDELRKTFTELPSGGSPENASHWYPRMTRAYSDIWDRDKPQYRSPIACHLTEFGKWARKSYSSLTSPSTHPQDQAKENNEKSSSKSKKKNGCLYDISSNMKNVENRGALVDAFNHFSKYLDEFDKFAIMGSDETEAFDIPSCNDIRGVNYVALLQTPFPTDYETILMGKQADHSPSDVPAFKLLTQLALFSRFVLFNVGVTQVIAKNEDYAFDIFESLNTTGEPLTAIETFKAKVLQIGTPAILDDCRSKMEKIDNALNKKQKEKAKLTENLLITFALEERGEKISKRLNDQRQFLKIYDQLKNDELKQHFVDALYTTYCFINNVWDHEKRAAQISNPNETFLQLDGESQFCLDFLSGLKHTVVQSLLSRYYSKVLADRNVEDFQDAIKACVAYSVLRRASSIGTDGIDEDYRGLMAGVNGRRPLCRLDAKYQETVLPEIVTLRTYFRELLKDKGIETKEKWVQKVNKIPLFYFSSHVARFLLMAASDIATSDKQRPGHMALGRADKKLLDRDAWNDENVETIEHIIPQTRAEDWNNPKFDQVYAQDDKQNYLLHGIGNLALCPKEINSSFGNFSWAKKRKGYQMCSVPTEGEVQKLAEEFHDILSKSSLKRYESKYLPMLGYLSQLGDEDLTVEFIEERGREIASLTWERIAGWLDLPKN